MQQTHVSHAGHANANVRAPLLTLLHPDPCVRVHVLMVPEQLPNTTCNR